MLLFNAVSQDWKGLKDILNAHQTLVEHCVPIRKTKQRVFIPLLVNKSLKFSVQNFWIFKCLSMTGLTPLPLFSIHICPCFRGKSLWHHHPPFLWTSCMYVLWSKVAIIITQKFIKRSMYYLSFLLTVFVFVLSFNQEISTCFFFWRLLLF